MRYMSYDRVFQPKNFLSFHTLWFNDTKMNTSSIKILKELVEGTSDTDRLRESLGVKHWQFNEHIKNLTKNDYVEKIGSTI